MISPAILRRQRAALGVVVPRAKPAGRSPTCHCGDCRKCRKRQWMRDYRAGLHTGPKRRGPRLDPDRSCIGCGHSIALHNKTGWCAECQHDHKRLPMADEIAPGMEAA